MAELRTEARGTWTRHGGRALEPCEGRAASRAVADALPLLARSAIGAWRDPREEARGDEQRARTRWWAAPPGMRVRSPSEGASQRLSEPPAAKVGADRPASRSVRAGDVKY